MPYFADIERPDMEPLEPRRLFAAGPVNVTGTGVRDVITIETISGGANFRVTLNGTPTTYAAADVSTFIISCGDGDDLVLISAGVVGVYADGGNGNDKIVGGDGADTFLGAAGKDQLFGAGGNDRINGAGGNDKVFGEAGADRLYGGDGADYIDGGSSGDRIYGGTGADSILGQGGNDSFFTIDGTADQLFGGSGSDTAHADSADLRSSIEGVALV